MTDKSAMTDAYAKSKARVEEGEGYDEDNWDNTTNPEANAACPDDNPFVEFGELVETGRPLKWWVNYHWTKATGTWANGWYNSNFDPKRFYELSNDGKELTLHADGETQGSCITSELVSEAIPGEAYTFLVTARVDSGEKSFAKLDVNAIFGIFTYQWGNADPSRTPNIHRELDLLEIVSVKWALEGYKTGNAQFTVQPATDAPGNIQRLTIPDTQYLTALMQRNELGEVDFKLFNGNYSLDEVEKAKPFDKWTVPSAYVPPPSGCARWHINLYLAKGLPPQEEQTVTITRIQLR